MKVWRRNNKNKNDPAMDAHEIARIRFFANIVNAIKTPLTIVIGQVDSALAETDEQIRNHQLRVARRNARRLERLADQAAQLTQLDAGSTTRRLRNVDLVPFVESLVMSFEDLAERHGLLLEFIAKRASIRGRVDPDMLTTVVSNLLSNATRYTPANGRIGVALDFLPPDLMKISVVDTGPGIAREKLPELFEPFFSASSEETPAVDGAGIGLPLARELTRLYGGDIVAQSDTGKGCRFEVTIPVGVEITGSGDALLLTGAERPEVTAEILFRSTLQTVPKSDEFGRATILLIDSNDEFRNWAAETLAAVAAVEAHTYNSKALQLAQEMLPDLVIASDRKSTSDGVDLARQLRADERTSHIPVLLIGPQADSARRIAAFDAGADEYLELPLDTLELRTRSASILERYDGLRQQFREQFVIRPTQICERSIDQAFLEKVTTTIEESMEIAEFTVQDLGDAVAMSTSQLSRKLRALIDQSPAQLIRRMRLQRAGDLVAGNVGQISDVCFRVGFSDQSHFSRSFKRHFGVSPIEYRRQHADQHND